MNKIKSNNLYGLLGKNISHSFSPLIHEKLGSYPYDIFDLSEDKAIKFLEDKNFKAINVTIPYKNLAYGMCDFLDEASRTLKGVNTIVNVNGKLYGYNTDYHGLKFALIKRGFEIKDKLVLIIGSGASSKMAKKVVMDLGAKGVIIVGRSCETKLTDVDKFIDANILINATPLGTYPNSHVDYPIDIGKLNKLEGVFDLNYNPRMTKLLYQAKRLNLKTSSGLLMLVAQAKFASEYFRSLKIEDDMIYSIYEDLSKYMTNIALIGMPGAGKTTLGKLLCERLNLKHSDIDSLIEERTNKSCNDFICEYSIEEFRKVEKEVLKKEAALFNKVISTGGGSIIDKENRYALSQNSMVFFIDRSLDKLDKKGRPLSNLSHDSLVKLYNERIDIYNKTCDYKIDNNGDIMDTLLEIIDIYEKHSSNKWT